MHSIVVSRNGVLVTQTGIEPAPSPSLQSLAGGRRWWAQIEFTPINIELTIIKKGFEELMNVKGVGEKSTA